MSDDPGMKVIWKKLNQRSDPMPRTSIIKSRSQRQSKPVNQKKKNCGGCRRAKGIVKDAGQRK